MPLCCVQEASTFARYKPKPMYNKQMKRITLFVLIALLMLAACAQEPQSSQPTTVAAVETTIASASATTSTASLPASAAATPTTEASTPTPEVATPTIEPTLTPTTAPTATAEPTAEPTATAAPPTPTADAFAQYAPLTIEGMRARAYGEGEIEIVRTMEDLPSFTRYLFAYQGDGLRLTGMLNRPKGNGPFPVVILVHGYYPLDVYQTGNGTKLAADYLANRGFMTLSPDLRSHAASDDAPNLFRAGHVIDVLNLIPLAQKLPSATGGKVGLWGHSNGGAIAAKTMVVSDQVGAALIYAPASSTIAEDYQFRVERSAARGARIDPIEWPVGPEEGAELYQRLSPLPYLDAANMPIQIHWGTADEVVPRKWPENLYNGLIAANKQAAWFEYQGQPHSFTGQSNQMYLQRMVEFYRQHIK